MYAMKNFKYQAEKPSRDQLAGFSPSKLKSFLKKNGYKINRDFFKYGSVAQKKESDVSVPLVEY
jgi:hypothetical protein